MKNEIKKSGLSFILPSGLDGKSWSHIKNLKRFLKFKYSEDQVYLINNKKIQKKMQHEITNSEVLTYA
jgi:hypothetical protein